MTPTHLDLRTLLPLTRAAFDAGQLQAQTHLSDGGCSYVAVCAIGAGLTPEQRVELDTSRSAQGTAIISLIKHGRVVVPDGQAGDFIMLQNDHDAWVDGCTEQRDAFVETLTELEARYVA